MAVENNMREVSSHVLKSLELNCSEDVVSLEDLAWADSCLIKDPELSESNWSSLKDALMEFLSSEPDVISSSAAESDYLEGENDLMITQSSGVSESGHPGKTDDLILTNKEEADVNTEVPVHEETDILYSPTYSKNPFLPNYKDKMRDTGSADLAPDFEFIADDTGSPSENIFKVWDLDIPSEEDDLSKKLSKAFEIGIESPNSTVKQSASGALDELEDVPLDGLIASIADLSLNQESG